MHSRRLIGGAAFAVPFWFLATYLVLAGLRPGFRHFNQAISELGSWDAPNLWWWNGLGYFAPGVVIAMLGFALARELQPKTWLAGAPAMLLSLSGSLMAMSGIFPGDFENRQSTSMVLHTIGALGSGIAFLLAAVSLPILFWRRPNWRWMVGPSLILVLGLLASGFLRSGAMPGLGQRISFAFFLSWVGLVGFNLMRVGSSTFGRLGSNAIQRG